MRSDVAGLSVCRGVSTGGNVPCACGIEKNIFGPDPAGVRTCDAGGGTAALDDITGDSNICRAKPSIASCLDDIGSIVDKGIKGYQDTIGPVVSCQLRSIGYFAVSIADHDGGAAMLKIVIEYHVIITKYAQTGGVDKIITIDLTAIAMAKGELGGAVADGVVADDELGCLYGDQFILSGAFFEYVVFDDAIAIGQAETAEAKLQCFGAVALLRLLVEEIVVMDMEALRDLAAGASDGDETAHGILMLKGIMVYFMIIAIEEQVFSIAGCLKKIAGPAAEAGTGGHGGF